MGEQKIFLKEQVGNVVFDRNGKVIPFHEVGDDIGGIKLDTERDAQMIEDIETAIKERRGGIYAATEGQYADVSKKSIWRPSNPASEPLKVFQPNRLNPVSDRPEDVAAVKPDAPPSVRPGATISPVLAQELTKPGKPAIPPAEAGIEPPAAPPVSMKPRVGRASKPAAQAETSAAATPAPA